MAKKIDEMYESREFDEESKLHKVRIFAAVELLKIADHCLDLSIKRNRYSYIVHDRVAALFNTVHGATNNSLCLKSYLNHELN